MLHAIAPDLWHMQHRFSSYGIPLSSRMTVVRLSSGALWLHSPVALNAAVLAQLAALGPVEYIVAPNKVHHLFAKKCHAAFPQARLFGAPGLSIKRPDLIGLRELGPASEPGWQDDLEQVFVEGIPYANETAWFHKASRSLILTDLCQWWQGELGFAGGAFAMLAGVRRELAVSRTVRMLVKDRAAARASANRILQWPFERVIVAHNVILEDGAHAAVARALQYFS